MTDAVASVDRNGDTIIVGARVRWIVSDPDKQVEGTVCALGKVDSSSSDDAHDILIDWDGLGGYVYMQHLVRDRLQLTGEFARVREVSMGPIHIAAGK